jgi:hypothetical protein
MLEGPCLFSLQIQNLETTTAIYLHTHNNPGEHRIPVNIARQFMFLMQRRQT